MKKILAILCSVCVSIASLDVPLHPAALIKASNAGGWSNAYFNTALSCFDPSGDAYFALYDIDRNNTPELLIAQFGTGYYMIDIYTYSFGSVVKCDTVYANAVYGSYATKELFTGISYPPRGSDTGSNISTVYSLNGTELRQELNFGNVFDANSGSIVSYSVNGNDVSASTYQTYANRYQTSAMQCIQFDEPIAALMGDSCQNIWDIAVYKATQPPEANNDWKYAYCTWLESQKREAYSPHTSFSLIDFDGNGIPELVTADKGYNYINDQPRIFTYENGELLEINETYDPDAFGGGWWSIYSPDVRANPQYGYRYQYDNGYGLFFKYTGNQFVLEATFNKFESQYGGYEYQLNGFSCSESEYNAALSKYTEIINSGFKVEYEYNVDDITPILNYSGTETIVTTPAVTTVTSTKTTTSTTKTNTTSTTTTSTLMTITTTISEAVDLPKSGNCGANCTWNYDSATKTLTISGSGDMDSMRDSDTGASKAEWLEYSEEMTTIVIGDGITSIGALAFSGKDGQYQNVQKVVLPETLNTINAYAFKNCGFSEIEFPSRLMLVGTMAFEGTPWLENKKTENPLVIINDFIYDGTACEGEVVIPEGVTCITGTGFDSNESITGVIFTDEVTVLDDYAFYGCTGLTSVTLPAYLSYIGYGVFYGCTSLETISIPETVHEIGGDAFANTPWLEARRAENPLVVVNTMLLDGQTFEGSAVIPDGVTFIAPEAFYENEALTGAVLPEGVKEIGEDAFFGCINLADITFPQSLYSIENGAFLDCKSLKELNFPEGLAFIGKGVFEMGDYIENSDPSLLEKVTIPSTVTMIDDYAFNLCVSLKEFTILNPDCVISDTLCINNDNHSTDESGTEFIPEYSGVIRGYAGSTAQAYAEKWGYTFESLGEAPAVTEIMRGDVDGDGEIGVTDAQNVLLAAVQISIGKDSGLTDAQMQAADVDGDGAISVADAQFILNYYVQNTILGAGVSWDIIIKAQSDS